MYVCMSVYTRHTVNSTPLNRNCVAICSHFVVRESKYCYRVNAVPWARVIYSSHQKRQLIKQPLFCLRCMSLIKRLVQIVLLKSSPVSISLVTLNSGCTNTKATLKCGYKRNIYFLSSLLYCYCAQFKVGRQLRVFVQQILSNLNLVNFKLLYDELFFFLLHFN